MAAEQNKRAPMASAPMRYTEDGDVDWGNMWGSFCALALEGGPPHRATMLYAQATADAASAGYRFVTNEIIRGIAAVSGLRARADAPGWIAVICDSAAMARWVSDAMIQENVDARSDGALLYVPAGEQFTVSGEIKNVITAVAKTTHYWADHVPPELKATLALHAQIDWLKKRVLGWAG